VAPPGANGTTMVIGCEGKGWEAAGLAAQRPSPVTAIRIARRLCTTSSSLELHAGGLHDLAPFGPLGPGVLREVVGRGGHGFGSHRLQGLDHVRRFPDLIELRRDGIDGS